MTYRIVAIGEVLWDLLPEGKQLGGAPANFSYHTHAIGADARLVSRVGDDALGQEVLERFRQLGLSIDSIAVDADAPTGTVSVALGSDGKPSYEIHENVAWDRLAVDEAALATVQEADAVYFGTLAQRGEPSRSAIRILVAAAPANAFRILDLNFRPPFVGREIIEASLEMAGMLKMSDEELPVLADLIGLNGSTRRQISELAHRYGFSLIALTRGPHGSLLWRDGDWSDHPGLATAVRDTVGAGDAFSAAMTLGILAGWSLDEINTRANEVAAYVSSQPGAMPALPLALRATFARK
jgi:fructokinase